MSNRPTVRTINVSMSPEDERYVQSLLDSGLYVSKSEIVREALRLLMRTDTPEQYWQAIHQGQEAGGK